MSHFRENSLVGDSCSYAFVFNRTWPATQEMSSPNRCFTIVPAAGLSQRMGQHKLLLPWRDGLLIDHVLDVWTSSVVSHTVVVIRSDDDLLRQACQRWPVEIAEPPTPPVDMKASVQIGLQFLAQRFSPTDCDACFIAPADLPTLSRHVIDALAAVELQTDTIVAPCFGDAGSASHPARLPWPMTPEIFELADNQGVNEIVNRHAKKLVSFSATDAIDDIDTLKEYQRAVERDGHS